MSGPRVQVDSVSCGIAPAKVKEVEVEGKEGEDGKVEVVPAGTVSAS